MQPIAVESRTLASIAYDARRLLLQLEFRDRPIYHYFGVPEATYTELLRARSKGEYFNRAIRGRFPYALAANANR